jgi:hypothetical protein
MAHEEDNGMDESAESSRGWSSWSDWFGDAIALAQRTSAVVGQVQSEWEDLSRRDSPWTTDTIMNEVVNSWERFTPVLGELVQHWVEGSSQALREGWPDVGSDVAAWNSRLSGTPMSEAMTPYTEVGRDAADRMVQGDFQSADAVETFAVLGGMWAKDMWRLAAEGRARTQPPDPDATPKADDPAPDL